MIKTIYSLTLSMIRVPEFQQTVEDDTHMLYRNESTKRKNMFQGKKIFFQERGGEYFFKFQGGIDQEVAKGGGLINIHFQGVIALCRGESFFEGGGLRGVLPSMVTLPLFLLHFQNMLLTLCQTNFSKLQKMLLVSHKTIFCENEAVHLCVTMQKLARAFVATIQCITFSYSFCR